MFTTPTRTSTRCTIIRSRAASSLQHCLLQLLRMLVGPRTAGAGLLPPALSLRRERRGGAAWGSAIAAPLCREIPSLAACQLARSRPLHRHKWSPPTLPGALASMMITKKPSLPSLLEARCLSGDARWGDYLVVCSGRNRHSRRLTLNRLVRHGHHHRL